MASNNREARRRKILERGSDRLAFITGQINDVPPPPSDSSSPLSQSNFVQESSSPRDQILTPPKIAFTSEHENISDAPNDDVNRIIHQQSRAESVHQPQRYAAAGEASSSAPRDATVQPSLGTSPSVVNLSASQAFTPIVSFVNGITAKHIAAAVDASECLRMFSALAIALFVISSHLGFSSLGNIVSFRPVFSLLLADATIVLGRVLLSHHGNSSSPSRQENSGTAMDQIGNALETVMMVQKIMDAILMDFSLYAVSLICGLLFTQSIFA